MAVKRIAKTFDSENESRATFTREQRLVAGKALREILPREAHADWKMPNVRRSPIDILLRSNRERVRELVPIRYGRMLASPFAFLRGSAGLMAHDLALSPLTGILVQACGDCHLVNFGMFATPERNLVFDINDFDETLPAPWEWDLKRLATSFVVAVREQQHTDMEARAAAIECVRNYREELRKYSKMSPLEVWYDRLDAQTLIDLSPDSASQKSREAAVEKAHQHVGDSLFPKIAATVKGRIRIVDHRPLIFHPGAPNSEAIFNEGIKAYRLSLPDERRVLFDRYHLADFAAKVVGIGSVGTRCFVALFLTSDQQPLLLQIKEACPSVLEPYAGKSVYKNAGQRVVVGQRVMQCSSDIFLGWARSEQGRDFFARQLRDMKFSIPLEGGSSTQFLRYAKACGWTLARAHAKSGDATLISGYLGKSDTFDHAIGDFALSYADQNETDHAALVAAVKKGRIKALIEDGS